MLNEQERITGEKMADENDDGTASTTVVSP